ncbi:sodium:sulfate symporter transmembrane region [Oesophagostomum dentatum]|uniref:Sodium:sulfate symporter transmembrane region n=1 Tax=Oesophagostomum dentatum TaxID=61180 RepID=A0A0B1SKJ2_OESDE|nr:sodium:sulfate symporter transmembrane region [Oesophagostomum dentatum]
MEVAPTGITSLLPIFLFPVLGISSAKQICQVYFKDSIVLFFCTLAMTLAVEETNLHKRIALKLLCKVGTRKQTMLLGFMGTTAFLNVGEMAIESGNFDKLKKDDRGFAKALVLACAHGSLIGGTAIITSTGPNLVFREIIQSSYAEHEISVSYVQWMMFAMPPMMLYLLASFAVITSKEEQRISFAVEKKIKCAYDELGKFTFAEKSILAWFILLMASWIMRKPGFIPGWGDLFPDHGKLLSDSVPAVLVVFLLFAWPKDPFAKDPTPILNWDVMKKRFAWSCVLLIGAGYAISEGVEVSSVNPILKNCIIKCRHNSRSCLWFDGLNLVCNHLIAH